MPIGELKVRVLFRNVTLLATIFPQVLRNFCAEVDDPTITCAKKAQKLRTLPLSGRSCHAFRSLRRVIFLTLSDVIGSRKRGNTHLEQQGEYVIDAPRAAVWDALIDPTVLAQCIDGCQDMTQISPEQFEAKVKARIGPVSATFTAVLELSDVQAPDSYTINANVKGGAAGFGKGVAKVTLEDGERESSTRLRYTVDASVGGKLAQIGSRLLDGAARKMADDFFAAFGTLVGGAAPTAADPGAAAQPDAQADKQADTPDDAKRAQLAAQNNEHNWIIWAIVFGALAIALLLAF